MSDATPAPPPPPPPGFGAPVAPPPPPAVPPGYAVTAAGGVREHPGARSVMMMSIVALALGFALGIGFFASPFIWARAHGIRTEMNADPQVVWSNRGNVTTAIVCGVIGTLMILVVLGLVAVYLLVGGRFVD